MSSTAYRDWASRRWRPTPPAAAVPSPAAKRATHIVLLAQSLGALILLGGALVAPLARLVTATSRGPLLDALFMVGLLLVAVNAAVALWLLWRLARAEASGDSR